MSRGTDVFMSVYIPPYSLSYTSGLSRRRNYTRSSHPRAAQRVCGRAWSPGLLMERERERERERARERERERERRTAPALSPKQSKERESTPVPRSVNQVSRTTSRPVRAGVRIFPWLCARKRARERERARDFAFGLRVSCVMANR